MPIENAEVSKEIGKRAYKECLRLGITPSNFARKYGVDYRCINRWGKKYAPSAYALHCLLLEGADLDYILDVENEYIQEVRA